MYADTTAWPTGSCAESRTCWVSSSQNTHGEPVPVRLLGASRPLGNNSAVDPTGTHYALSDGLDVGRQQFSAAPDAVCIAALVSKVELSWDHQVNRRGLEFDARYSYALER